MSKQFRLCRSLYTAGDFGYDSFRLYWNEKTELELPDLIERLCSECDPQDIIELVKEADDGEKEYAYLLNGFMTVTKPMTEKELINYLKEGFEI